MSIQSFNCNSVIHKDSDDISWINIAQGSILGLGYHQVRWILEMFIVQLRTRIESLHIRCLRDAGEWVDSFETTENSHFILIACITPERVDYQRQYIMLTKV